MHLFFAESIYSIYIFKTKTIKTGKVYHQKHIVPRSGKFKMYKMKSVSQWTYSRLHDCDWKV